MSLQFLIPPLRFEETESSGTPSSIYGFSGELIQRLEFWRDWLESNRKRAKFALNSLIGSASLPEHLFHLFAVQNLFQTLNFCRERGINYPKELESSLKCKQLWLEGEQKMEKELSHWKEEMRFLVQSSPTLFQKRLRQMVLWGLSFKGEEAARYSIYFSLFPEDREFQLELMSSILSHYQSLLERLVSILRERKFQLSLSEDRNIHRWKLELEDGLIF